MVPLVTSGKEIVREAIRIKVMRAPPVTYSGNFLRVELRLRGKQLHATAIVVNALKKLWLKGMMGVVASWC